MSNGTPQQDRRPGQDRSTARLVLLALLVLSLISTGVSIAFINVPGALVSACFVALFYVLLVGLKLRDRRVWAAGVRRRTGAPARVATEAGGGETAERGPEPPDEVLRAERTGFRLGLAIAAPLAALAILLAVALVGDHIGWKMVGLGALLFFGIMIFMGAPIWLAAVEEGIEEAEEKETGTESRSIR